MLPITSLLFCTAPIDELECFPTRQKHHAKTYVSCLVVANNETVEGISTHVLPAKSERALNKYHIQHNWDTDQLNKERLALALSSLAPPRQVFDHRAIGAVVDDYSNVQIVQDTVGRWADCQPTTYESDQYAV